MADTLLNGIVVLIYQPIPLRLDGRWLAKQLLRQLPENRIKADAGKFGGASGEVIGGAACALWLGRTK